MEDTEMISILIQKQDNLMNQLSEIKVILAHQEENLKIHMKRSDELEKYVNKLELDIKPIQKHIYFIEASLKSIGVLATGSSVLIGLYKMYIMFTH